jgi:hypothetical protein
MSAMAACRTFAATLSVAILACGSEPAIPNAGASPYTLAAVGGEDVPLHPNEERTLHVLLTQDEVGPVASARVHFEFRDGDPGQSRIDAADVVTDEDGIARVHLTAGSHPGAPFRLVAATPELGAAPVAFSVTIIPERRLLQIVPTAATRVANDGATATTLAGVFSSVALRVRELDADTGEPIAGDRITFTLPPVASSRWSTTSSRIASAQTGLGGEARVYLITAQAAEGPWQVVAQAAGAASTVTFDVTVQGGSHEDEPPPDADCDPAAPACGGDRCCDPAARICRPCIPDENVPDLSGVWLTKHDFNLRESLPIGLRDLFRGIRLMDQTLLGKLTIPGLPGWLQEILNAFVSRLLQQYLPGWTQQVIHVSDDLFTILSHLRSEGTMRLTRDGDSAHLQGKEAWTSLVFYWLPLCNGEIAGDPGEPPECARIDVVTTDSESAGETAQCKGEVLPSIRALVSPFTGTVVQQDGVSRLEVDERQVTLKMGKVLLILVDQLLTLVTGGEYHCIEEATLCASGGDCLVDCLGLGRDVENATEGIVDSGTVEQLCAHGVRAAGELVVEALARAWPVTADTLDFSGSAVISGQADDSVCHRGAVPRACASRLGEGRWTGDLFFRLLERQPGTWEARRPE